MTLTVVQLLQVYITLADPLFLGVLTVLIILMIRFYVLIPEKLIFIENPVFSLNSEIMWFELQRETTTTTSLLRAYVTH